MTATDELRKYVDDCTDHEMILASIPPQHRVTCTRERMFELIDEVEREAVRIATSGHASALNAYMASTENLSDDELADMGLMRLPVDVDGVPIRMGDTVRFEPDGEPFEVRHIRYHAGFETEVGDGERWGDLVAAACVHCEPPTVEDEIRSIVQLCFNIKERGERWSVDDVMQSGNVSDVVAKLRLSEEGK